MRKKLISMPADRILTVTEINREINDALRKHHGLWNCWVTGEISNYKDHIPSGHWYFTIKDENAGIKAVMFKTRAVLTGFKPQNGMKVLVRGNIKLYEKDGSVQLYAEEIFPSGLGALYVAFEQLRNRLTEEGLFAAEKKRPIPKYPQRIAVVTSPTGAAFKDILNIAKRRNPLITLIIVPSAVQGDAAPGEIARAIALANNDEDIDLLIVGRGGGSLEELWAFNTEEVARAVAGSRIPVISAVGHEIDYTIADFAADLRAPTPSAAAELAIPMLKDLRDCFSSYEDKLNNRISKIIERKRSQIKNLQSHRSMAMQDLKLEQLRQDLDILSMRLKDGITGFITERDGILKLLSTKLDLLSPLTTLSRGYTIAMNSQDKVLDSVKGISEGDELRLRFKDGKADCLVKNINIINLEGI